MSEFFVGQEVVCVDASVSGIAPDRVYNPLILNARYIVSEVIPPPNLRHRLLGEWGLRLKGVSVYPGLLGFHARRFRPVVNKPDSIAIFRQMCISPRPLVPVE